MSRIDARIAERRHQVRRERQQRRLRRTVIVVVFLLALGGLYALERSPLVALEEVRIEGTVRLDPSAVERAAALQLGTSTLRLRLDAAEERVERLPLVREAHARRTDPLTVLVSVTERVPVLVAVAGNQQRLLDDEGVVLAKGSEPRLPTIRLPGGAGLPAPGQSVSALPPLANAHRAYRQLPGPLRSGVVRYDARGPDELDLHLASGMRVRFGRATRVDEKARALGAVLEDIGDASVGLIDVRAPSTPVVRR